MRRAAVFAMVLGALGTLASAAPRPADQPRTMDQVMDRVIANENKTYGQLRNYSPLVETYIQHLRPDKELGYVPAGDKYFLGRAVFTNDVQLVPLTDAKGRGHKIISSMGSLFKFSVFEFLPEGFLQMIFIDTNGFDKQHYKFDYIRREFLGEVRCLVFDVTPLPKSGKGRFLGRIWVEDQNYNVVRFNGAYTGNGRSVSYFHFDSWRSNLQPNMWLPSYIYSEEHDLHYDVYKKLDFKSQTRLWGYNLGHAAQEQELSKILVETPVTDQTKTANDLTPIQAQRNWDRQAEDNLLDRLERIGLLSPKGEVDKVLETVVNNLEVTNNIDVEPEVRCRVMLTTSLESFTIGHTIILSRGLIDVLPDEASLAMILAKELSHVVLGHRLDAHYAFFDQLLVDDKATFRHFGFARTPEEEQQANAKALQLLNNSPYKNQLANAALFTQALEKRQKEIPNLISAHLGNRVPIVADVKAAAPADSKQTAQMLAALPIGGRVKLDPWSDRLEMIKSKPIGTVAEREKMPFEVTPFMPYLTRYAGESSIKVTPVGGTSPTDAQPGATTPAPTTNSQPGTAYPDRTAPPSTTGTQTPDTQAPATSPGTQASPAAPAPNDKP
ncbi:MAG TPA: M48 family metalloprotease [Candidatus Dormibacteraeota bacterium]|nr:M48 family metalloprotease [Candidatus Dormibacteraeota bacterium]